MTEDFQVPLGSAAVAAYEVVVVNDPAEGSRSTSVAVIWRPRKS